VQSFKLILLYLTATILPMASGFSADNPKESPKEDIDITADNVEFHEASRELIARGNAELDVEDTLLTAGEIRYQVDSKAVTAEDKVMLAHPDFRLLSEKLGYQFDSRKATSGAFLLGRPPFYIEGESLDVSPEGLLAKDSTLYYGEPEYWSPAVRAREAILSNDGEITLRGATARIGPIPFLYLPYVAVSGANSPIKVELNGGYTSRKGVYMESTTLLNTGDLGWIGAGIGIYTNRGVMVGPAWDYVSNSEQWRSWHRMRSGWLYDMGKRGLDRLGDPIPHSRGYVDYQGRATYEEKLELMGALQYWSDSDIYRDFFQRQFDENQEPDSFVQAMYKGTDFYVTLLARPQINSFYRTIERLPEVRVDQMPRQLLDTGVYYRSNLSVSRLSDRAPLVPTIKSDRVNMYAGIERPFDLGENSWVRLVPVAGTQITYYDKTISGSNGYTRAMGELGADLEMDFHRTWDAQVPRWKINGLRHRITPFIQYRWLPGADSGRNRIPVIDQDPFLIYPPVVSLADTRNTDFYKHTQILRFGVRNVLQTRDDQYGSRDLVAWNIYYDLYPGKNSDSRDDSDLFQELVLTPNDWLKLDLWLRINPSNGNFEDVMPSISIYDGEIWWLRYSARYFRKEIDQHMIDGWYRINETWGFGARFRFDSNQDSLTEQTYGVSQKIGNAWTVNYEVQRMQHDKNENGWQFRAVFNYLHF
jgi:LPS-assembly protein